MNNGTSQQMWEKGDEKEKLRVYIPDKNHDKYQPDMLFGNVKTIPSKYIYSLRQGFELFTILIKRIFKSQ
jgi:hypothetical protein